VPRPAAHAILRYGLAVASVGLAVAARGGLEPAIGTGASFFVLQTAVVVATWLGGPGPGLAATLLAGLLGVHLLSPLALALLVLNGAMVALLLGARAARRRRHDAGLAALRQKVLEADQAETRLTELIRDLYRRLGERNALALREQASRLEAERRARQAQLLVEVARSVSDSLDLDRMLPPVAAAARELGEADVVRIVLRRPGAASLGVSHTLGARSEGYEGLRLEPDVGIAGRVLASGRPYSTVDMTARDPLWPGPEDEVAAALVVPIRVGARVDGLLCVERRASRPFGGDDETMLLQLADHVGIAIRNVQLLAGEQSARAEAEAASRAKDEFLAMLGHELRNPLGAISNATRVLHEIGDQATRLQDIIGRQTQHLARLLDDLLDVSRLTMGKIALSRRAVDLREVVRDSLGVLEQEGKTDRHDVHVIAEPALVDGDPTRLEQIVRNLLDNALKYTPPGGRVNVTVSRDGEEAVLRVTDTGAGIPAEVLPRIFDLFVQAERSLERSMGGLGLGLTLVKRLVELHGGSVSAWSAGPEQGSEFVIRLPILPDADGLPDPVALPVAAGPELRVLVVEDNRDAREGLRMLLEAWGHQVEEAEDGQRGLDLALGSRPDVALVDVGLPVLDGYQVAQAIRGAPGGERLLLVAVTGYGQPEDARRAREAGFDAHLVKPIDPDELRRLLRRRPA
jgi:signal transduction histidine kinase/CheY-like chemotaxis protein